MLAGEGEVGPCAEVGEEGVAEQVALAQFLREGGLVAEAQAVAEGVEEQEERLEEECSDEEGEETAETEGEIVLQDRHTARHLYRITITTKTHNLDFEIFLLDKYFLPHFFLLNIIINIIKD